MHTIEWTPLVPAAIHITLVLAKIMVKMSPSTCGASVQGFFSSSNKC